MNSFLFPFPNCMLSDAFCIAARYRQWRIFRQLRKSLLSWWTVRKWHRLWIDQFLCEVRLWDNNLSDIEEIKPSGWWDHQVEKGVEDLNWNFAIKLCWNTEESAIKLFDERLIERKEYNHIDVSLQMTDQDQGKVIQLGIEPLKIKDEKIQFD